MLQAYQDLIENKDIPEGGAKGTILSGLSADYHQCFEKYVDVGVASFHPSDSSTDFSKSIIDLLIPGRTPGIKGPIVDVSGRTDPEILFFGPDEVIASSLDTSQN